MITIITYVLPIINDKMKHNSPPHFCQHELLKQEISNFMRVTKIYFFYKNQLYSASIYSVDLVY